jgi:hypothetical protein
MIFLLYDKNMPGKRPADFPDKRADYSGIRRKRQVKLLRITRERSRAAQTLLEGRAAGANP